MAMPHLSPDETWRRLPIRACLPPEAKQPLCVVDARACARKKMGSSEAQKCFNAHHLCFPTWTKVGKLAQARYLVPAPSGSG